MEVKEGSRHEPVSLYLAYLEASIAPSAGEVTETVTGVPHGYLKGRKFSVRVQWVRNNDSGQLLYESTEGIDPIFADETEACDHRALDDVELQSVRCPPDGSVCVQVIDRLAQNGRQVGVFSREHLWPLDRVLPAVSVVGA